MRDQVLFCEQIMLCVYMCVYVYYAHQEECLDNIKMITKNVDFF